MMPNRIEQVKAHGAAGVARAFGFTVAPDAARGRPPQWVSPCPACGEATRHHKSGDRRGAVGLTPDGAGWRCFQCDASGDAFGFAAWAELKREPRRGDAREVLEVCAGLGLCDDTTGKAAALGVTRRTPPIDSAARHERPPPGELAALWAACQRLEAVPAWELRDDALQTLPEGAEFDAVAPVGPPGWCGEARRFLVGRGLDVGILSVLDITRILPPRSRTSWPRWWPYSPKVWRVAVPMFDATGAMVSIQARAITRATPKDRNALGYSAGELVFASPLGRSFLAGDRAALVAVLITEGLTDTLKVAARIHLQSRRVAVLGVVSGSAPLFAAVSWPPGLPCWIATDADETGQKYAAKLLEHLPAHVRCERVNWGIDGEMAS